MRVIEAVRLTNCDVNAQDATNAQRTNPRMPLTWIWTEAKEREPLSGITSAAWYRSTRV